jgi:stringent starvation protein B
MTTISTKPYFLRAIYEWCTDNGFTPYLAVKVFGEARVPMEFVRNGDIVLNVSFGATSALKIDNEAVSFKARFGGISRDIWVPLANVQAIYASENGEGMAFEVSPETAAEERNKEKEDEPEKTSLSLAKSEEKNSSAPTDEPSSTSIQKKSGKPSLKIIK